MKTHGPKLTIEASCMNCEFERSERYVCQGDSGHVVYCDHTAGQGRIGDTTWTTPTWCPLLAEAKARLLDLEETR